MFWKILNLLFGKRHRKRPVSATEIVKRGPRMEQYIEWSKNKHIVVFNPPFWGIHDIFVDSELQHAVFCLKHDRSAFVFLGDSFKAVSFTLFDSNQEPIETTILEEGNLSWTIYDDYVLYRGTLLPASTEPYYWGKVAGTAPFEGRINEKWVLGTLKGLLERKVK